MSLEQDRLAGLPPAQPALRAGFSEPRLLGAWDPPRVAAW